jgi:hypothetical protein
VGSVEPIVSSQTIPLSSFVKNKIFKFVMEFIFVTIFMNIAFKEISEIRARKVRLKFLAIWTKGHKILNTQRRVNVWIHALHEHYISGDEPISNLIDLLQEGFSLTLCIVWVLFVYHALDAEHALVLLHRTSEIVNYDDQSLADWPGYHRAVDHVEILIATAIHDMVHMKEDAFRIAKEEDLIYLFRNRNFFENWLFFSLSSSEASFSRHGARFRGCRVCQ